MTAPEAWALTRLGNACELINGRAYKQDELLAVGKYRVIRVGNFFSNPNWYHSDLELDDAKYCDSGDLLYAWSASFGPKIWDGGKAIFHYHIWRVKIEPSLADKIFLYHWFQWDKENIKAEHGTGSTMIHVTKADMEDRSIALPPLAEQRRIVAKLNALTARTARARADLDRIPALAARYKQAVLEKAFSGELTAAWREGRSLTLVEEALCNIRGQRRPDKRLARRLAVASPPEGELPPTWAWISPDEIAADALYSIGIGPFGSNLVQADYRESGTRLIFVRDIRRERFDDTGARYVTAEKAASLHQHVVSGGEVLITKMGDPPGDTTLYPQDAGPAVITADCVKLKPHPNLATGPFLVFAIRSEAVREQLAEITAGVAQQKISLERFRTIALPIPPLEEQEEIVRRITAAFAEIDRLTTEAAAAHRLLDRLDQAVLAKAFRGELVPQDPADESASVVLDRIRAERTAAPKAKRGRKPVAAR